MDSLALPYRAIHEAPPPPHHTHSPHHNTHHLSPVELLVPFCDNIILVRFFDPNMRISFFW